jgi:hypothetical protein
MGSTDKMILSHLMVFHLTVFARHLQGYHVDNARSWLKEVIIRVPEMRGINFRPEFCRSNSNTMVPMMKIKTTGESKKKECCYIEGLPSKACVPVAKLTGMACQRNSVL